jgi:hypothetical protein
VAGSTLKDRIFSGVEAATSSMSMPPSVEQTKEMRLVTAVDEQREIQLPLDARAVLDVDAVDDLAGRAGLMRHERAAEHLLGLGLGLFDRFGQAHTAFVARVGFLEAALAAAACVDLRLHDPERPVQFARRRLGLFGFQDGTTVADRSAVVAQ